MRVILLLISLFVCTALSAQTFTVYTNTISEHNVYNGQKTPDDGRGINPVIGYMSYIERVKRV